MAAAASGDSTMVHYSNSCTNSIYLNDKWKLSKKDSRCLTRSRSTSASSSSSSSSLVKNRRCAFTRKCGKLVKEQMARFYIMRRCVTMLVCWRDYSD